MFSIIIPTWNNLPYLKLVVDSLRRHSAYDHQIIVHVNDGSDGTLDWVRSEGIEHTASPTNIGICHAVNLAAARATRDYVVYMNDDMFWNSDTSLVIGDRERARKRGRSEF
jgi:glycosyltransferase involved in cell wall biosynthesis